MNPPPVEQALASTVIATLSDVQVADGPVARQFPVSNIRASLYFLLDYPRQRHPARPSGHPEEHPPAPNGGVPIIPSLSNTALHLS